MKEKLPEILVIDDDTRLRNLLGKYLSDNGFLVESAKNANDAEILLAKKNYDLLIIDVMMPGISGFELATKIRKTSKIPILMLTARGDANDRIDGLEAGADDYMPKPFEPKELLLRIKNILKRFDSLKIESSSVIINFGGFSYDLEQNRLSKLGNFIHITESEVRILSALGKNFNRVISREKLSEICGGVDERTIDVQITRLRRKIEDNPKQPQFLQTIRGKGYILRD